MTFCYADPPYPGKAFYYPERQEVDHSRLLDRLTTAFPDGWALSTSSRSLRDVLQLCPPTVRVCAWFKGPRPTKSRRAIMSWEPLIVYRGRPLDTRLPQVLNDALIAQGRYRAFPGALVGMKPPAFAEWMFRLLGAQPGDELVDMYPGSGAIARAWARYVAPAGASDGSQPGPRDASNGSASDASRALPGDRHTTCLPSSGDASHHQTTRRWSTADASPRSQGDASAAAASDGSVAEVLL